MCTCVVDKAVLILIVVVSGEVETVARSAVVTFVIVGWLVVVAIVLVGGFDAFLF